MKKTILAIAIPALFASAANAAVIYDKDGTTFDVYGRVQANFYGDHDNSDAELIGASRLGWSGKVALNNTWSGIAKTEWQVASENSDNVNKGTKPDNSTPSATKGESTGGKFEARHIYVGFDGTQYGQIIFGQTDTAYYDAIAATDIFNEWGSEGNLYDGRQEGQIIYSNSFGGFHGKVSYQTNDDAVTSVKDVGSNTIVKDIQDVKLNKGYGAAAGYKFDFGLGFDAGYNRSDLEATADRAGSFTKGSKFEKSDWAISSNYAINGFYFAAMYNETDMKNKATGTKNEGKGYELAATYTVDAWTFLAGYNKEETRKPGASYKDSIDATLLGVQYAFTSKLKAYSEYKIEGLDNKDDQWTVALQYNF
ncbi:porin [Aeromonas jandaei]|uniref:porin n=1 Tax=Aeromonas jandaei TaxID=650 RepID=UPI001C5AEA5A|nr:porin [Aeromonas jandaei]MBW3762615.1 porin [Aeromonas jandaei]